MPFRKRTWPAGCCPGRGWLDWLGELQRESLLEELLAEGVIARALEEAPHRHSYDRTLTGKMTVICVLVACLFPGTGYDTALATAFGLPGLNLKPGTDVPTGPAFSKARTLLGEQAMRRRREPLSTHHAANRATWQEPHEPPETAPAVTGSAGRQDRAAPARPPRSAHCPASNHGTLPRPSPGPRTNAATDPGQPRAADSRTAHARSASNRCTAIPGTPTALYRHTE